MTRSCCPTCGSLLRTPARTSARVPYSPAALAQIRAGASAAALGWDQSFYETICRRHGLAAMPAAVPLIAQPAPAADQTATPSQAVSAQAPRRLAKVRRQQFTYALPADIWHALKHRAEAAKLPLSTFLREAILRACADDAPLPDWRRCGKLSERHVSVALSPAELGEISAASRRGSYKTGADFIRRIFASMFPSEDPA